MNLDCDTEKGKTFIESQHDVEKLVEKKFGVTVKTKDVKISKYDADIFSLEGNLKGVCEIKTRPFWKRDSQIPFTFEMMKRDRYMITAEKLDVLQKKSLKHGVISCIFLKIPHERRVVCIQVTDKKGNFLIDFFRRYTKTYKTCNDYKGKRHLWNAYIKYDPKTFKDFTY